MGLGSRSCSQDNLIEIKASDKSITPQSHLKTQPVRFVLFEKKKNKNSMLARLDMDRTII